MLSHSRMTGLAPAWVEVRWANGCGHGALKGVLRSGGRKGKGTKRDRYREGVCGGVGRICCFEETVSSGEESGKSKIFTIPTILTLARVGAIPILIAGFFGKLANAHFVCTSVFVLAALTDWLDGYLARKLAMKSSFGTFLDPVADKLMVVTVLVLLSSRPIPVGTFQGNGWILPCLAAVIIGREITMSSLREWAASVSSEAYKSVAVSGWGKWKTAFQMIALTLLLLGSNGSMPGGVADSGVVSLGIATILTVWSLTLYFKGVWKYLS